MRRETQAAQPRLVSRRAALNLLGNLKAEHPTGIVCKLVPAASLCRFDLSNSARIEVPPAAPQDAVPDWSWLPRSASTSGTGMTFIYERRDDKQPTPLMAIAPPFPILNEEVSSSFGSLEEIIDSDFDVGIILIRLGRFAIGVARRERLLVSKCDTRHVRGRHRAGGQSSNRFRRNREKQIREFFDKAAAAANSVFGNYLHEIDWIALGGDEHVINSFLDRTNLPDSLMNRVLARRAPVSRPSRAALERAAHDVWASTVFERSSQREG